MKITPRPRPLAIGGFVTAIATATIMSGCAIPNWLTGKRTDNRAFIQYWPPPKESSAIRLAVKDNIDVKGVVTTAGSEFLARQGEPAKRDAACLAIARNRNVQIVGKANLS